MIQVTVLTAQSVLHEGEAASVVLPGDRGVFEVLPMHKPILSLLRPGRIVIDQERALPVRGGVVRVRGDRLVALVEPADAAEPGKG